MYRLTDDLARNRQRYSSPIDGMPSVVLIDMPERFRGSGLSLGRYYVVVVESAEEISEFESFLATPRSGPVAPDLFDLRPSMLRSDEFLLLRLEPPAPGWPWLSVSRWPDDLAASVPTDMARRRYTFEAFSTEAALVEHQAALLAFLARHRDLRIKPIAAATQSGRA